MTPVNVVSFTHLLLELIMHNNRIPWQVSGESSKFLSVLENSGSFQILKENQTIILGIISETFLK